MSRLVTVATVAVCTASIALAADLTPQSFVSQAASSGMAEIQLAQLAKKTSDNPKVEQFADMMITDHKKADSELQAIAKSEGVTVPTQPLPAEQAAMQALEDDSGAAFDAAYAKQMVQDHQKAVDLFQRASDDSSLKPELRSFAQKTLPTLQHHLDEAKRLNDALAQAR